MYIAKRLSNPATFLNLLLAVLFSLLPMGVAQATTIINYFGADPQRAVAFDGYMSWFYTPELIEYSNTPMGLADLEMFDDPGGLHFKEVGAVVDSRPFVFDQHLYPYTASQDGSNSTYYEFTDKRFYLVGGPYHYKILHEGVGVFTAYWCSGAQEVCYQIGDSLHAVNRDSYTYSAAGHESNTSTRLTSPLIYVNVKYQWATNNVWYPMCPYGYPQHGTGLIYAVVLPCSPGAGGTANFNIAPAKTVFTPFLTK